MDKYINQSINARKEAFAASFEIDAEAQGKIDALFAEIEKLGANCKDVGEFETEFAESPLNKQYLDLFTEIAKKGVANGIVKGAAVGVAQSVAEQAFQNVVPTTRAAAHQKAYDAVRDVPVLDDVIDVAEKASYVAHLGKLFKKKKDK